jgi:hypothetical protein
MLRYILPMFMFLPVYLALDVGSTAPVPLRPRLRPWRPPPGSGLASHDSPPLSLASLDAAARLVAGGRRHHSGPTRTALLLDGRFCCGTNILHNGTDTELHLASFCLADAERRLEGADVGPTTGHPDTQDRVRRRALRCTAGAAARPLHGARHRDGRGANDHRWIQHSTVGHAASVVFVGKPDGSWRTRICYDDSDWGLNTMTRPAVEPLLQIDTLCGGLPSLPSSTWPAGTNSCGCEIQTGGRRVFVCRWGSSNGMWCQLGSRGLRRF